MHLQKLMKQEQRRNEGEAHYFFFVQPLFLQGSLILVGFPAHLTSSTCYPRRKKIEKEDGI